MVNVLPAPAPALPAEALPAFGVLLDAHGGDVYRYAVAMAGPLDGPDCFQEAVIAALRAYPSVSHAENLRGWLFTIAHRKVLDHYRSRARRPEPRAEPLDARRAPDPADASDPADAVVNDVVLAGALRGLPAKQRAAVALRYLADLPYAQIGAVLSCSEPAARQNVRAGLAALRSEVRP